MAIDFRALKRMDMEQIRGLQDPGARAQLKRTLGLTAASSPAEVMDAWSKIEERLNPEFCRDFDGPRFWALRQLMVDLGGVASPEAAALAQVAEILDGAAVDRKVDAAHEVFRMLLASSKEGADGVIFFNPGILNRFIATYGELTAAQKLALVARAIEPDGSVDWGHGVDSEATSLESSEDAFERAAILLGRRWLPANAEAPTPDADPLDDAHFGQLLDDLELLMAQSPATRDQVDKVARRLADLTLDVQQLNGEREEDGWFLLESLATLDRALGQRLADHVGSRDEELARRLQGYPR